MIRRSRHNCLTSCSGRPIERQENVKKSFPQQCPLNFFANSQQLSEGKRNAFEKSWISNLRWKTFCWLKAKLLSSPAESIKDLHSTMRFKNKLRSEIQLKKLKIKQRKLSFCERNFHPVQQWKINERTQIESQMKLPFSESQNSSRLGERKKSVFSCDSVKDFYCFFLFSSFPWRNAKLYL